MGMKKEYSLDELSRLTGIEARTIRSYFERGLLQGADRSGPKARYGQYHLDRLRAIKLFRDSEPRLTLDKIRMLLQSMSESDIRMVARGGSFRVVDTDDELPLASASPEDRQAGRTQPAQFARRKGPSSFRRAEPPPADRLSALDRLLTGLEQLVGQPTTNASLQSSHWHEIEITPDLRLSVKGDYSEAELLKFRRMANYLRSMLMGVEEKIERD